MSPLLPFTNVTDIFKLGKTLTFVFCVHIGPIKIKCFRPIREPVNINGEGGNITSPLGWYEYSVGHNCYLPAPDTRY